MERLRQACTRIAIFIKKLKKERAGRLRESLGKIREGSGIINPLLRLPAHPITILLSPRPPPHLTPFLTSSSNPNLGEVGRTDRAGRLGELGGGDQKGLWEAWGRPGTGVGERVGGKGRGGGLGGVQDRSSTGSEGPFPRKRKD